MPPSPCQCHHDLHCPGPTIEMDARSAVAQVVMVEHVAAETEDVSAFQRYPDLWHDQAVLALLAYIQGQSPPAALLQAELGFGLL